MPSSEPPGTYHPRLADADDSIAITLSNIPGNDRHGHVHFSWPPPGLHTVSGGLNSRPPYCFLAGEPEGIPTGDWYVTSLGFICAGLADVIPDLAEKAALWYASRLNPLAGGWAAWPVLYAQGEGKFMRWLKTIYAGTLGAGEQFQHQINFGKPGDDPDLNEVECGELAVTLATLWQTMLNSTPTGLGGGAVTGMFSPEVTYTKVGVVKETQTDGTESDGSGGDLEQAFPTAWAPINTVSGVVGTGAANSSLPYEVACAVSLHTAHLGPSGRGRTYFPPFYKGIVGAGGNFVGGQVQGLGLALGTFFVDVTTETDLVPVVVSRRRIILNEVIQITVGIVPDSQRRRRWAMPENPLVAWTKP